MLDGEGIARFVLAFVFTQVIEVPIYVRALHVKPKVAFGASAITHPVVWFVMPLVWRFLYIALRRVDGRFELNDVGYFVAYGVLAEGFAVVVEAAYLRWVGVATKKAIGWAIVANATSSLVGLGIRALTGWP